MVYGELSRFPLSISIKVRMIGYWARMIESSHNKLNYKLLQITNNYTTQWLKCIKSIFEECNLVNVFERREFTSSHCLKKVIFHALKSNFIFSWKNDVFNSPEGTTYIIYKHDFIFENYLIVLPPRLAKAYCKFRTCNVKLPIECSRCNNIPREQRFCSICKLLD